MEAELSLTDTCVEWISKLVTRDGSYNDLSALLDFNTDSARLTASGTREIDYPPVLFHAGGEVEVYKSFSLPPDLVDKFAGMQRNCLMGIFTQCERAWVAIDNELFMWNYEDGEDLAYYDGVLDTIISVGLATPREGVLPNSVSHLLCIATPLELVVLGMTYSYPRQEVGPSRDSPLLQVIPDPLYCISTDNYSISSIEATAHGRIFLGTKDGFMLEFCYGRIPGWDVDSTMLPVTTLANRRGPCSIFNHSASALSLMLPSILTSTFRNTDPIVQMASDAVRRLVYIRTEESSLSVFSYLGGSERQASGLVPSPASLNRLACVTSGEITSAAASIVRSVDRCQFKSLVSIVPLSSGPHHLLAVTRTGIRLYFDERLRLLHVRLPPTSPYGTVGLSDVRLVAETRGTVVMVCTLPPPTSSNTTGATASSTASTSWFRSSQLTDGRPLASPAPDDQSGLPASPSPSVVYTISPDPFPWTPNLTEVCTSSWCVSGAWALTVLPSPSSWWAEGAGGNRLLVEDDAALRRQRTAGGQSASSTSSLTTSFPVGDLPGKTRVTPDGHAPITTARGRAPIVLTQHLEPPFRRLLLISAQGLVHLRLANPLFRLKEFILGRKQIHLNSPGALSFVEANSTTGPRRQVSSASFREFSLTQAGDQQPSFGMLDNNRFLTSYLHQFSPDEAICAALALGAEAVVWNPGLKAPSEFESAVEQVVLFFAAEAAENWLPAVKCWSDLGFGQGLLLGPAPPGSTPSLQRLSEKTASGLNSSIFLFTGFCVFVARMSRAFWHTPLFRDGTEELTKLAAVGGPTVPEKGIGSWVRSFVSVLASAATAAASPLKGKEVGGNSHGLKAESSKPSHELFWLWHQLAYAQRFLRRHLRGSGGWLHADHSQTFLATAAPATVSEASYVAVALHRLAEATDGLLSLMLELIGFWRILGEHGLDVHRIVRRLTGDQCHLLLHLPFEAYLSELYTTTTVSSSSNSQLTGCGDSHYQPPHGLQSPSSLTGAPASATKTGASDLLTSLVNALVDHYLSRQEEDEQQQLLSAIGDTPTSVEGANAFGRTPASVGLASITGRLLEACPTLFAKEDAISAKASECLVQVGILRAHLMSTGRSVADSTTVSGLCSVGDEEEEAILDEIDRLATRSIQLYTEAGPGLDLSTATHRLISSGVWRGAVLLCLRMASLRDPTDVAVECLKHGRRPSAEKSVLLADGSALGGGGATSGFRRHLCVSELAATEARYAAYYQMVVCLEQLWELCQMPPTGGSPSVGGDFDQAAPAALSSRAHEPGMPPRLAETYLFSPSSARSLMRTIIQEVIIASNDILAHFEVINWLLARGLTDMAVSLNSPHMEGYLRSRLRQSPDDPDLRCLLWRQLERRGARIEAAKVLEHLAVTPCSRLTLDDRLNFAARAIVVVKSLPASQQDMDYLHDMESRLELAQLQQQLHTELNLRLTSTNGQSPPRCSSPIGWRRQLEEAVHQLGHGPLLSPTEMFTQYADRFDLHESKLFLLWASDSQDVALIKAVWRDLLQSILSTPSTSSSPSSLPPRGRSRSPVFSPRTPLSVRNNQRSPSPSSGRRHGNTSGHRLVELSLVHCLSRLGHRFCPEATAMVAASPQAQLFFPLGEIVATLERYAIQQSLPVSWVPVILRDTRLPCCTAFASDAYDALLHSKEAFWRLPEVRNRLLSAFVTVAEEFLLTVTSDRQSRLLRPAQTSGRLLDQVTGILVDLNSSLFITTVEVDKEKAVDESMMRRESSDAAAKSLPLLVTRLRRLHDQLKHCC